MVLSQKLLIVSIGQWEFIIGVLEMQELYVLTQVRILLLTTLISVKVMNIESLDDYSIFHEYWLTIPVVMIYLHLDYQLQLFMPFTDSI